MTTLRMRVQQVDSLTPSIRRLLLTPANGTQLLEFAAGAHIGLHAQVGGRTLVRAYSLVNMPGDNSHYEIAVQLEPNGSGGSRWVHQLSVGAELDVTAPRNEFALQPHACSHLLIAGGIGITPILSMARALNATGQSFELHYAAREAAAMAYRDEVMSLAGANCWLDGGDPRSGMPLAGVIGVPQPGRHLYVCGPKGLTAAVLGKARELDWNEGQLHSELFTGALSASGDAAFEVVLAASGVTLSVSAETTILDAMLEAGLDPLFDCRRGDCGVCTTRVIEGEPDHRDVCLSEKDHRSGDFCPCVSRARSPKLVLDL
jgi:ferredoxin-NADP reductase